MEILILILGLISYLYLDRINFNFYCLEDVKGHQLSLIKNNLQLEKKINVIYIIISAIIIIMSIINVVFFALEKKQNERMIEGYRVERRIIFRGEKKDKINEEENNNLTINH